MNVSVIMPLKGAKSLAESFQKSIAARLSGEGAAESLDLLYSLKGELEREGAAGKSSSEEIGRLVSGMGEIRFADELQAFSEQFERLLAEQFAARASVNKIHELSNAFHEKLVTVALLHASSLLHQEGRISPEIPSALLVSGELGRREVVLGERSSFFFVFQDCGPEERRYFDELAIRYLAVLSIRFPAISRNLFKVGNLFWSGSRSEWYAYVSAPLKGSDAGQPASDGEGGELLFSRMFEIVADLRSIGGDKEFSEFLLTHSRKLLAEEIPGERFWRQARNITTMPLALGIFGRLKTKRHGAHKGEFSLKELAIDPLVASSRVLAVALGINETATVERLKAVLATGNLGVALADRLLVAFQDCMRQLVRIELQAGRGAEGLFLNPDDLDEVSRERLRGGLDDISTLQRLVHQQLVEVEQQ